MSEENGENVELYRRAVAAWNDGDLSAWLAMVSPDWEFRTTGLFPGVNRVYHGPEGATQFFDTVREPWEYFFIEIERVIGACDQIVGLLRFRGRGKSSGVETTLEFAHTATYAGGKGILLEGYVTHAEALKAAGLSE